MSEPARLHKQAEEPNPLDDLKIIMKDYLFMNKYVCYAIIITLLILAALLFMIICFILVPPTYGFFWW